MPLILSLIAALLYAGAAWRAAHNTQADALSQRTDYSDSLESLEASVLNYPDYVVFDLDPGSETYSELRLTLRVDNQPASETWLYRWTA